MRPSEQPDPAWEWYQRRRQEIDEQMRPVNERARELADGVMATLDDASAEMLFAFAEALRLADRPLIHFSTAIVNLACEREDGKHFEAWPPARSMSGALKEAAAFGGLVELLEEPETPFWRAVVDAVAELEPLLGAVDQRMPGVYKVNHGQTKLIWGEGTDTTGFSEAGVPPEAA